MKLRCQKVSLHARKFARCNDLEWSPTKDKLVPPKDDITNENMEEFFVQCWEDGSKPNVTQGRRFINHILTNYGKPPLNKHHRQAYASVLDVLQGMQRTKKWRDHLGNGADPLTREHVKKILLAEVHDDDGELNPKKLRNKVIASLLILCGWHPVDAWRILDVNVINLDSFHDSNGHHRPAFYFNDLSHNKRPKLKVSNTVGCGCKDGCGHDSKNVACPYNILNWYSDLKDQCDEDLIDRKNRLSRKERLKHFDENGNLTSRKFFRAIGQRGTCN